MALTFRKYRELNSNTLLADETLMIEPMPAITMNQRKISLSTVAIFFAFALPTCHAGIVFKHTFDGAVDDTRFDDGTNGAEQAAAGVTSKATKFSSYGLVAGATDQVQTNTGSTSSFDNSRFDFSLESTSNFDLQSFSFDIRKLGGGTVQSYYRVSIRDGTSTEYLSDQSGSNGGTLFADDSTLGTKTFSLTNLSTISNSITSASQITFRLELGVNGTGSTPDRRLAFDNVALLSIDNDTVPEPSSLVAISLLAAALSNRRSRGKS